MFNQSTTANNRKCQLMAQTLTLIAVACALNIGACPIARAQFDLGSLTGNSAMGSDMGGFGLFTQAGFGDTTGMLTDPSLTGGLTDPSLTGGLTGTTQLPSQVGVIVEPDPPWQIQDPSQIGFGDNTTTTDPVQSVNFSTPSLSQWDLGSSQVLGPIGGGGSGSGGVSGNPYTKEQYNTSGPPTRPSGSQTIAGSNTGQTLSTGGGGTVTVQTICPY